MLTVNAYVELVKEIYSASGDPVRAEGQMKYMRNKFEFYGLKAAEWVAILRRVFKQYGVFEGEKLYDFVRRCFEDECREIHYCGLQMLEKQIKTLPEIRMRFLKECIQTQSWWDTVDWVNKLVGIHFKRFPELQRTTCESWIDSGDIWLQRVTMIHQLTYKEATDVQLMFDMINRMKGSKEFFIQKGAGWALRQYSKTDASAVTRFIDDNPDLAPLTKREGLKWLKGRA